MSVVANFLLIQYQLGKITDDQLVFLVNNNKITQEEYNAIKSQA